MRLLFTFSVSVLFLTQVFSQNKGPVSEEKIKSYINYLSSDELKGRKPGTEGDSLSAFYIRKELKANGVIPIFDHGFQRFNVLVDVHPGNNNTFQINGTEAKLYEDYLPATFSSSESFEGNVAFAGYGFDIENGSEKWNDYENIDVSNKWVMVIAGKPDLGDNEMFNKQRKIRTKALTAKDKGAKGILIIVNDKSDFNMLSTFDNSASDAGIPVIYLTSQKANDILKKDGLSIEKVNDQIIKNSKPDSHLLKATVKAKTDIVHEKSTTYNVVALLEGTDPVLKNEYIVIGAHYDHLGMGGSESGSRMPDTMAVHNGADDNASGVAGVIGLADAFASSKDKLKRSLIFVAFTGEEMGMLGSKEFVNNPPYSL